jgi:hypothetical protein
MVVPTVAAITALRSCALWSESESPLGAAISHILPTPPAFPDGGLFTN